MFESKIQWTDHTINFWTGCKKVSPGCKYCYMYRDQERWKKNPTDVIEVKQQTIDKVLKEAKPGDKIFTCSWSDFFIEEADAWRPWAWEIIRRNPQFIWQILTKRPERIAKCLPADWGDKGWAHVWLGVSVETDNYKSRLVELHRHKTKSSLFKTFVSYEPALGYLDLAHDDAITSMEFHSLDWLIVGGESGNDKGKYLHRPCELGWIENIVNQCKEARVPVFVKQLGTHLAKQLKMSDRHGGNINDFPEHLKIREFPIS